MSMSLDETMGAMLLGVIGAGILYGVTCSQIYFYYTHYRKDVWTLKLLVAAVWITDSAHQAFIMHSIYDYLVTNFANPSALFIPNNSLVTEVIFNALTGLFVQSFFALRIWKLSGRRLWIILPVMALVLAEFVVSITYTAEAYTITDFSQLGKIRTLSILMNAFAAAGDVAIAASLCVILHTSRSGFTRSNTLINRLMVFAVNTGLLTSICACLSLITFFTAPNGFVYITFYFLIGRLYSNSLMATLNARKSLREGSSANAELSLSLQNLPPSAMNTYGRHMPRESGGIAIRIDTTKKSTHDNSDPSVYNDTQKHVVEEV